MGNLAPIEGDGIGRGGRRPGRPPGSGNSVSLGVRERLAQAKAAREESLAELAALEVAERSGALIPQGAAVKSETRAGMAIRDAMLSVPGRVAARLVGMDDERKIERILTEAIRAELTRLARSVSKDAA